MHLLAADVQLRVVRRRVSQATGERNPIPVRATGHHPYPKLQRMLVDDAGTARSRSRFVLWQGSWVLSPSGLRAIVTAGRDVGVYHVAALCTRPPRDNPATERHFTNSMQETNNHE